MTRDPQAWSPEAWARLGRAIREARERAGLTQKELASAAGASVPPLRDAETGVVPKARMPYTLAKVAGALGWPPGTVEVVLDGGDPPGGWQSTPVQLPADLVDGIMTRAMVRATNHTTSAEIREAVKIALDELRRHGVLSETDGVQPHEDSQQTTHDD
jgi:transcriptional regulator with XRE-family HTH domain